MIARAMAEGGVITDRMREERKSCPFGSDE